MIQITPNHFGKIGVLMGGVSAEREISLMSGQAVCDALTTLKLNHVALDLGDDPYAQLSASDIDIAFIALHGGWGEDGVIQNMLSLLKIPYTGSDGLASALAMHKVQSRRIFESQGLPVVPYKIVTAEDSVDDLIKALGLPLVIKPNEQGSSVGVHIVERAEDFFPAYEDAARYDDIVLAEKYITGGEYTVGYLGRESLPSIKIETDRQFYDYQAKYFDDNTRYLCPSLLSQEDEKTISRLAVQAMDALAVRGWGRADFLQDEVGKLYLLEVNTIPGLTSHSLVPKAARHIGIPFEELVVRILLEARV